MSATMTYHHLLQAVANLGGPDRTLTAREIFDELVAVITQEMGAQRAALLISEGRREHLSETGWIHGLSRALATHLDIRQPS